MSTNTNQIKNFHVFIFQIFRMSIYKNVDSFISDIYTQVYSIQV